MSGFNRAQRRRQDRERVRQQQAGPRAELQQLEGAVFVNDRDLGPGMFGLGVVDDPDGVVLSFLNGPGRRDDNVELLLTPDAAMQLGGALTDYGIYCSQAPRRNRAAMN